ncbi:MAG: alpha/beta hydrolase [Bacteroidia bacterium]|nr:alpha/beta hydrolase [Bacteroidia bacterium]
MANITLQEGTFQAIPDKVPTSFCYSTPENPKGLLILAHGAGAGMNHANMKAISDSLNKIGLATFRYNFIYMEQGKGRESAKQSISTVKAATHYGHELAPTLPILVGGHSYGGRMSSHAASEGFDVPTKGMIYFNFPLHAPGKAGDERGKHLLDISLPQLFLSGSRDTFSTGDLLENLITQTQGPSKIQRLDTGNHSYKILKKTRRRTDDIFEEIGSYVEEWLEEIL